MSQKSRWFLGFACAALLIALARSWIGEDIADFSTGLATALMIGVLVAWKGKRAQ